MRPLVLRFAAPRIVELHEADLPEPRAGEVLVRTLYSGISSGTEMLAYRGQVDPSLPLDDTIGALGGTFEYPFEYGYSAVGVVEDGAGNIATGARVFAFQPHRSLFSVPSDEVIDVSDIDPRVATLFPLVETGLQISLDAGVSENDDVVVVGLGAVGTIAGALIARTGARLVAAEPSAARRAVARAFGLHAVAPEDIKEVVADLTGGRGVRLVVEVSGNPAALASSLSLLAHEGTVLVASWFGTKPVSLPLGGDFHRKRLTITSSQVSTIPRHLQRDWDIARRRATTLELMSRLPLERLATHTFPIEQAPAAFAAIDSGDDTLMHAALCYPDPD